MNRITLILSILIICAVCVKAQNNTPGKQNIVVWGNSITWGSKSSSDDKCYCAILQKELELNGYNNYSVINCGVGGESYQSILVRQGGIGLYFDKDISFHGKTKISLGKNENYSANHLMRNTFFADKSRFFLLVQGESGRTNKNLKTVNPLTFNGKSFTLSYKGDLANGEYFITPNEDMTLNIPKGAIFETSGSKIKEDIVVFAMGTNGGYLGNEESFNEEKAIENAIDMTDLAIKKSATDKYVVCSPYAGTALKQFGVDGLKKLEKVFQNHYGEKYLNWRKYLVSNGLKDAGIAATEQDAKDIRDGKCPTSLLSDGLHPNDIGHKILGERLFNKLKELNYVECTSGISHIENKKSLTPKIYSINGVKLQHPSKGVNIVDGKKLFIP